MTWSHTHKETELTSPVYLHTRTHARTSLDVGRPKAFKRLTYDSGVKICRIQFSSDCHTNKKNKNLFFFSFLSFWNVTKPIKGSNVSYLKDTRANRCVWAPSVCDHSKYLCLSSSSVRSTTSGGGAQSGWAETAVQWGMAVCFHADRDWMTPPRGNLDTALEGRWSSVNRTRGQMINEHLIKRIVFPHTQIFFFR